MHSLATMGIIGLVRYGRPPPLLPEVFALEIEKRTFTNDADVEVVKTMFDRVCKQVLGGVEHLDYNGLGWSSVTQARDLGLLLCRCPRLRRIELQTHTFHPARGPSAEVARLGRNTKQHPKISTKRRSNFC